MPMKAIKSTQKYRDWMASIKDVKTAAIVASNVEKLKGVSATSHRLEKGSVRLGSTMGLGIGSTSASSPAK